MRDVAGYEIVRKLGSGSRSEVYLGHAPPGGAGEADAVAVKVFGPGVAATSIDIEVAALAAVHSEHVVVLRDVATFAEGRCALILERLPEGSLSRLLRIRAQLAAGEAVTIVASVLRGLSDLHSSGYAHGRLTGAAVLFDAAGRPVLIGLGHATSLGTRPEHSGHRRRDPPVLEDYRRLAVLAQLVCDRVDSAHCSDQLKDFVAACSSMADGGSTPDPERLEDLAFAIAQPAPVRLRFPDPASATPSAQPLRMPRLAGDPLGTAPGGKSPLDDREPRPHRRRAVSGKLAAAIPALASTLLDGRPLRILRERLASRVRSKRRLVWFAAVLSSTLLIAAITVLPTEANSRAGPVAGPDASARKQQPGQMQSPPVSPTPTEMSRSAAAADDPAAATLALLQMRDECLLSRTLDCLDGVDQSDSMIHDADRRAVASAPDAAVPAASGIYDRGRFTGFAATLIQRTGNSALVALAVQPGSPGRSVEGGPASVFLVKGGTGWRLREIFSMQPTP